MNKRTYKKTYIIDRSKWVSGGNQTKVGKGYSQLLNANGFMCCLGFCLKQEGFEDIQIHDVDLPEEVVGIQTTNFTFQNEIDFHNFDPSITNTTLSNIAVDLNDDCTTTAEKKEKLLKELFNKHNLDIIFEGKYTIDEKDISN